MYKYLLTRYAEINVISNNARTGRIIIVCVSIVTHVLHGAQSHGRRDYVSSFHRQITLIDCLCALSHSLTVSLSDCCDLARTQRNFIEACKIVASCTCKKQTRPADEQSPGF
ncbi:hypothetical protein PUN28_006454 [Cardiocondyla obscurior]|uniref:Uncharacterized protein n=1 Tax=Cardiocondyla obscurior TaxID=286306 RepID=A0AAW2GDZ6_9HYME